MIDVASDKLEYRKIKKNLSVILDAAAPQPGRAKPSPEDDTADDEPIAWAKAIFTRKDL